jgi:hypothetical protein
MNMTKRIRTACLAVLLGGAMLAPVAAQTKTSQKADAGPAAHGAVATHSTTGVVKSIDSGMLVIARDGRKHGEMTFTLNPATEREGAIKVGTKVSVRYHADGKATVATAVVAQPMATAVRKTS